MAQKRELHKGFLVGIPRTIRFRTEKERKLEKRLVEEAVVYAKNREEKVNLEGYIKKKLDMPPLY